MTVDKQNDTVNTKNCTFFSCVLNCFTFSWGNCICSGVRKIILIILILLSPNIFAQVKSQVPTNTDMYKGKSSENIKNNSLFGSITDVSPTLPLSINKFNKSSYNNPQPSQQEQSTAVLNRKIDPRQITIQHRDNAMGYSPPKIPSSDPRIAHQQILNSYYSQRKQNSTQQVHDILAEENRRKTSKVIQRYYELPSYKAMTQSYSYAYNKLLELQNEGTNKNVLLAATYQVENAFFDGQLDFKTYKQNVTDAANTVRLFVKQNGFDINNKLALNWGLYKYMTDTISIDLVYNEQTQTHFPMKYDFEDFYGDNDLSQTFVSKLMVENTGQCRSMPLRGRIISEALGTNYSIALAPNHYYLMFSDEEGTSYNFETTRGKLASDAWIMSSIKNTDAIRSKSYMKKLSEKEEVSLCMLDLVRGYMEKYGVGDGQYVLSCIENTIKTFEQENHNCIRAHLLKWHVYEALKKDFMAFKEVTSISEIEHLPEIKYWNQQQEQTKAKFEELGYENMTPKEYQRWLDSIEEHKNKQEHTINMTKIMTTIRK